MTTTPPAEVAAIVRGLTKAQREAMLRAEPEGHLGKYFIRWWVANVPTIRSLKKRDLGSSVWSGLMLSDLGLRVRAALQEEGSDA